MMSMSEALSSENLFFVLKKWHHSEETGSTWNHRFLSKAQLTLQMIPNLCAQTEPWLFICEYLVIFFSRFQCHSCLFSNEGMNTFT